MKALQDVIGYHFRDEALLRNALTHSSYANEKGGCESNERLEFLGDSVLGFVTADYLYHEMKNQPEGELTKRRAAEVCEKSLHRFAKSISLGEYLLLGKGELHTGGRERPSILADAWMMSEYANRDANVSKEQLVSMFKQADRTKLMNEVERTQLDALADPVTVYRGVTNYNAKNIRALSWTLDYDTAAWFAHRFGEDGMVYQAKIKKEHPMDILLKN